MFPRPFHALSAFLLLVGTNATAAEFLVDTTDDDGGPAFQICDADAANANCSLRGALAAIDASPGPHTIRFDLPTSDAGYVPATAHWRFSPATPYPYITRELTIDGYTQPGATPNTLAAAAGGTNAVLKIEIAGPGRAAQTIGLQAVNGPAAAPLLLRGIAINRFFQAIYLMNAGVHRIEGCFIGTDISGMSGFDPAVAGWIGIINSVGTLHLGGSSPGQRNLVSGNLYIGLWDKTPNPARIEGNLFGTNATGTAELARQDYAIHINALGQAATIGGSTLGAGNLFAANRFGAIYVDAQVPTGMADPQAVRILGNRFGTDPSETLALGNGLNPGSPSQPQATIFVFGTGRCGIAVGGDAPGEGNLIAHSGAAGVQVANCTQVPVLGNRFLRNRRLALDLSLSSNADGTTANDAGDADEGGNRLQNSPEITSFACVAGTCTLGFRVDTAVANAAYPLRIDLMRGRNGQPEASIASTTYLAGDAGLERTISFAAAALAGGALVLSATDALDNTSEFAGDHLFWADFD
ncbi:hypothetical protein [Dokdonella sp.]|uniref:hypothetical protein n=1 Tax=Dokdonella sp. TaxID=2291710 RepID=UPI0025C58E89|nr:hypothetical protein [Dokdonella sp.]MBX3693034.1 hypothetical protein [Dokdonella sp.]